MTDSVDQLIQVIDRWQPHTIVVVGDFMLDRYIYGHADRLSPDAPVPVLTTQRIEHQPGGAANVCMDLRALRCDVTALGVVGPDDPGRRLRQRLTEAGCDTQGLIEVTNRPTTVKHNFVGLAQHRHPQKMFRVDDECRHPLPDEAVASLLTRAARCLAGASVLCMEDYNKGVLTEPVCRELIGLARRHRVPVLVDPAAINDYAKYHGATCLTPNWTEAVLATGIDPGVDPGGGPSTHDDPTSDPPTHTMAQRLIHQLDLQAVVITLDKQGALLAEADHPPQVVPTHARAVYDVSGAGDMVVAMVVAMLAAARANGANWHASVRLANTAAGLAVERFGAVPIELDEILLNLLRHRHERLGKLRRLDQLLPELSSLRRAGKTIVFTNGCFDILHAGHVNFLRAARRHGDVLIVGLNSDTSIRRLKGDQRPINQQTDRVLVMSELASTDYLVLFDQDTPTPLLEAIRPDVLVKGAQYHRDQVVGADLVESYGGRVALVEMFKDLSTTHLIDKITTEA